MSLLFQLLSSAGVGLVYASPPCLLKPRKQSLTRTFQFSSPFFLLLLLGNDKKEIRAEVEPISTFLDYGEREFMVIDTRGYEHIVHKLAEDFLSTSDGKITDGRLQLNKVKV